MLNKMAKDRLYQKNTNYNKGGDGLKVNYIQTTAKMQVGLSKKEVCQLVP